MLDYAGNPNRLKNQAAGVLMLCALAYGYNYYQNSLAESETEDVITLMQSTVLSIQSNISTGNDSRTVNLDAISPDKVFMYAEMQGHLVSHTGWSVTSPFGYGPIVVKPTIAYNNNLPALAIEVSGIPQRACRLIATRDFGPAVLDVTSSNGVHARSRPFTPEEADRACPDVVNLLWWAINISV